MCWWLWQLAQWELSLLACRSSVASGRRSCARQVLIACLPGLGWGRSQLNLGGPPSGGFVFLAPHFYIAVRFVQSWASGRSRGWIGGRTAVVGNDEGVGSAAKLPNYPTQLVRNEASKLSYLLFCFI